jgi:hypothetical protein
VKLEGFHRMSALEYEAGEGSWVSVSGMSKKSSNVPPSQPGSRACPAIAG